MLESIYDVLTDSAQLTDARMDRLLLLTPLRFIGVITLYLVTVYKVGPKLMEHRQPFSLKPILLTYNIIQIAWNLVIFLQVLGIRNMLNIACTPYDTSDNELTHATLDVHHSYLLLKYFDLVETIFFVLRKRHRQISFLHVFHHVGMLVGAFISGKYFPGGQAMYIALYNTIMHCVMYCYYLLTSLNSNYKGVWWKKYITVIQIVQHCFIFASMFPVAVNMNCSYPKGWTTLFLVSVLFIIYLFVQFYRKTYLGGVKTKCK